MNILKLKIGDWLHHSGAGWVKQIKEIRKLESKDCPWDLEILCNHYSKEDPSGEKLSLVTYDIDQYNLIDENKSEKLRARYLKLYKMSE